MNMSILITRIKMNLGIYSISLPVKDIDGMIMKIIEDITIPVYSIYHPFEDRVYLDLNRLKRLERTASFQTFLLPEFSNKKLLYVKDVKYDDRSLAGMGYWGGTIPYMHGNMANQAILSNAGAHLVAQMLPKLTFEFKHPRTLRVYNLIASHKVIVDLAFEHDKSLQSLQPTSEISFFDLALLDVKANLYPTVKHYNGIETAYGRVDLHIDDWANAEEQRKEMLREWDETYHLDMAQLIFV